MSPTEKFLQEVQKRDPLDKFGRDWDTLPLSDRIIPPEIEPREIHWTKHLIGGFSLIAVFVFLVVVVPVPVKYLVAAVEIVIALMLFIAVMTFIRRR